MLVRAVYLRSDLDSLLSECERLVQAGLSPLQIDAWKEERRNKARALMAHCTLIEDFKKTCAASQPRHREARAEFFASQGAKLSPPLSKDVMEVIMAFKMSLDSNTEPTARSWGDLKKKMLHHRAAAEALLDLQQQNKRYRELGQTSTAIQKFRRLHNLRSDSYSSKFSRQEQIFVITLGRQQLKSCQDRAVADEDLVLLVLKGVFEEYQKLPQSEKPRGTNADFSQGTYILTLDDARMILHEVIEPEIRGWHDRLRSLKSLYSFKCVGCVRKDCATRYTFSEIFQHIHEKHAIHVAEGEDFHKLYRPFDSDLRHISFPWYTVEWPKNLPIAAAHQIVSKEKKWLANVEVAYVSVASSEAAPAFYDRRPFERSGVNADDFGANMIFAATKLRPTTLNVLCQMRIAMKYALDRYAVASPTSKPSLANFIACLPKLQAANEDFTLTFSCSICKQTPDIPQSAIHTRAESLMILAEHFEKTHRAHDWTLSLLDFPSDAQLGVILQDADDRAAKEKKAMAKRQASLAKNPRKKAQPHAGMILHRPEAMAIFEELFPRIQS